MLQLKTYRVKSKEEPCIRINTRKLNRVPVKKCYHILSNICILSTLLA